MLQFGYDFRRHKSRYPGCSRDLYGRVDGRCLQTSRQSKGPLREADKEAFRGLHRSFPSSDWERGSHLCFL